ncbi:hypothetical protein HYU06_01580 [Candidatus Woesearchaeota archaeon]|nr:hypothetical protein [Candidatus Woesearchaeota archaeon]
MKIYRQGDVVLKEINDMPDNLTKAKHNILAFGEVTGHKHQLLSQQIVVLEDKASQKYVQLKQKTILQHEEHKALEIDIGNYQVIIEREFNPFEEEIRQVMD